MIDKIMRRKGFDLIGNTRYGVVYEKQNSCESFSHVISLHCAGDRYCTLQSYDRNCRHHIVSTDSSILLLMWLKAKILLLKKRIK